MMYRVGVSVEYVLEMDIDAVSAESAEEIALIRAKDEFPNGCEWEVLSCVPHAPGEPK